jgi:hypothetical protein
MTIGDFKLIDVKSSDIHRMLWSLILQPTLQRVPTLIVPHPKLSCLNEQHLSSLGDDATARRPLLITVRSLLTDDGDEFSELQNDRQKKNW